jgi:hypothetical protein
VSGGIVMSGRPVFQGDCSERQRISLSGVIVIGSQTMAQQRIINIGDIEMADLGNSVLSG